MEVENNNVLPLLVISDIKMGSNLATNVYRKPTQKGH
jgi:hypothetical protein